MRQNVKADASGDDDSKKEYCEKLIDKTEDDLKALELTVSDLGKAIADYKEYTASRVQKIVVLVYVPFVFDGLVYF